MRPLDRPALLDVAADSEPAAAAVGWCVRAYLPACLHLLTLDEDAAVLARAPRITIQEQIPDLGLLVWDVARRWRRTAAALAAVTQDVRCPPVCLQLAEVKAPALDLARQLLPRGRMPRALTRALKDLTAAGTSSQQQAAAAWQLESALRGGGTDAAAATIVLIDRLGDGLAHAAAGMAAVMALTSGQPQALSAAPVIEVHRRLSVQLADLTAVPA